MKQERLWLVKICVSKSRANYYIPAAEGERERG